MGANTHVDLGNTGLFAPSVVTGLSVASGVGFGLSGATVGQWIDLNNSDTMCQVWVAAGATSGPLLIQVQCNDTLSGNIFSGGAPLSGNFTDPTSGLAQLPTWFSSGGILIVNSGLYAVPGGGGVSGKSTQVNGALIYTLPFGANPIANAQGGAAQLLSGSWPEFCSGGIAFAGFQRPARYARLVWLSGATSTTNLLAGFYSQLDTTGSGGGFTFSPGSGSVNV